MAVPLYEYITNTQVFDWTQVLSDMEIKTTKTKGQQMSQQVDSIEFILRSGGELIKRSVTERTIAVPDNLLAAINKDVAIPIHGLVNIEQWGWLNLMVTGAKFHYCTVPVQRIILRTGFDLQDKKEKIFVPNFASSDPQMELSWTPPADMAVIITMTLQQHKDADFSVSKAWLYAVDEKTQYWKLPLANVYDDGSICEGRAIGRFPTMVAAILDMLQTFDRSRWNRDLWHNEIQDATRAMFRFKEEEGKFITLAPTEKKWTKLCQKVVVNDVQKNIIL